MDKWALVGVVFAMMFGVGLLVHGWPRFFTINIHKHYRGKGEDES